MITETPGLDVEVVLRRLEELERQNRRTKTAGATILILGTALLVMGQAGPNRTVEAERFVIRHPNGKEAVALDILKTGPRLVLSRPDGTWSAMLSAFQTGPSLALRSPNGTIHVELGTSMTYRTPSLDTPAGESGQLQIMKSDAGGDIRNRQALLFLSGSSDESALYLYGKGATQARLRNHKDVGPALEMYDSPDALPRSFYGMGSLVLLRTADLREQSLRGASLDEESLNLWSAGGKSVNVSAASPSITLKDKEGFSAVIGSSDLVTIRSGETHKTSAASVTLFGKDEKVMWRAP